MPNEALLLDVSVTFPDLESARLVRQGLLEKRLAASVQLMGPMESAYWWGGELREAVEYRLWAKARLEAFEPIRALVEALHPYELPEVIATPVVCAGQAYRQWLQTSTRR